jgi:hypothetical protein
LGLPGKLEVLGRNDDQIKIRGQMVNLAHVDTVARALATVADAGSKVVKAADGEVAVALFVVLADCDSIIHVVDLRRQLEQQLPAYAVPMFIERAAALPRNVNGKLVRQELPEVGANSDSWGISDFHDGPSRVDESKPDHTKGSLAAMEGPVFSNRHDTITKSSNYGWCLWNLLQL